LKEFQTIALYTMHKLLGFRSLKLLWIGGDFTAIWQLEKERVTRPTEHVEHHASGPGPSYR
jgi:hypothetical protein